MTCFNYFVGINIYDLCNTNGGFRTGKVSFVEMSVTVKKITRLGNADEPVQCFQAVVGGVVVVMDSERGRMTDQNIQRAPVLHSVEKQAGEQGKGSDVGFGLGVLVDSVRTVTDGTAKSADQEFFVAYNFEVQVEAAFGVGFF